MREIRTSGLTRGSNGFGESLPLLSTLLIFVVNHLSGEVASRPADETSALPGPPSPVFRISTFSFPHYEEGEYSGSRGAAEHAERIQFSSLRALRASA